MDRNDDNLNIAPDDGSFSVDAILAEYEAERALFGRQEKKPESAETHHIVYDSSEQTVSEAQISSGSTLSDSAALRVEPPEWDTPEADGISEPVLRSVVPDTPDFSPESAFSESTAETAPEPEEAAADILDDELFTAREIADTSNEEYASKRNYAEEVPRAAQRPAREPDFSERVLGPVMGLMAASSQRREQKRRESRRKSEAAAQREQPPELRADRAAAFYEAQAQAAKMRCIFASVLTLPLLYLSFGLPAMGLLGSSPTVKALVCLILELVILVIGLDIFSNGILTLFRGRAGAESLIAISCIVSAVDAAVIAITGNINAGLPFCGASALSLAIALWGNYFSCRGFAVSFKAASGTEAPTVVLSLSGVDEEGCVLAKAKRPVTGFVRASEASDVFESSYRFIAPVLLAGCVILSLFVFFASEKCDNLLHTLAACFAACASLSAVFGFAFPFYVLSKRLAKSGVAIAGYSGAAELGRIRRVLISDTDIFPLRTLSIADVSISESARADTVVSYTGSMIAAAGMGIAPVFTELMRKNGCTMQKVEDFACHEGGGLVARINGDLVYVGTSAFMQLMGVRLPKGASQKSAVYTSINDSLTGIISVSYKPVASVQRALVTLLRGRSEPLFVVRDFNITPLLVKQKFRLPLDSYNFPSFADRYRISSTLAEDSGTVAAMFTRGGLNAVAGLHKRGRGLYNRLRISLALSLLGAVLGLVLMLALCWSGSYDSANCGNLIVYLLLWLVPTFVVSLGLRS